MNSGIDKFGWYYTLCGTFEGACLRILAEEGNLLLLRHHNISCPPSVDRVIRPAIDMYTLAADRYVGASYNWQAISSFSGT
jgi:antitoxin component HigA of HigAB toxin-antitoxin module